MKERETLDVLKELEATKMAVDELKTKINVDRNKESGFPKASPSSILMELKQAKVNLTRASIEALSKEIENERTVIEETRQRISFNSSKIVDLEKELHQTRILIEFARDAGNSGCSKELHKLNSEVEQYKRMTEAGEEEISRMKAEIERMKGSMKKMEEKTEGKMANKEDQEEEANGFKEAAERETVSDESEEEMLRRVKDATIELEVRRTELAEALALAESTNQGKLAAEEALRRWRSEHNSQRRRRLVADGSKTSLRPTLSIGQILSQKLYGSKDFEAALYRTSSLPLQPKISLGEMLSRRQAASQSPPTSRKRSVPLKIRRKKSRNFGFAGISLLLANQSRNQTSGKKKRKKKEQLPQP